jgi:uncharacterized protein YndB with AHSA1/START domain
MTEQAGVAQNQMTDDAVVVEQQINASPERVFQAISDPKQLRAWWDCDGHCDNELWEIEPRVGGRLRVRDRAKQPLEQLGGIQAVEGHGVVTVYDPPRTLEYTWIVDWSSDLETRVRYDLLSNAGGTLVRVTHSGLREQPTARKDYGEGWGLMLRSLVRYCERAA